MFVITFYFLISLLPFRGVTEIAIARMLLFKNVYFNALSWKDILYDGVTL